MTSKLQVTIPRAIADQYRIRPGDEIQWSPAGETLRVTLGRQPTALDTPARLRLFDQATRRQAHRKAPREGASERGWTREELYDRGRSR